MEFRTLAVELQFPEGPVALGDGSVLLVEIAAGAVTRVDADGGKNIVARTRGGPNGAPNRPPRKSYVANNRGFRMAPGGRPHPALPPARRASGRPGGTGGPK